MRELNLNEITHVNGGNPAVAVFLRNTVAGGLIFEGLMAVGRAAMVTSGMSGGGGQMKRNNSKTKTKSAN